MAPRVLLSLLFLAGCESNQDFGKVQSVLLVTPEVLDFGDVALGSSAIGSLALKHVQGGEIDVLAVEITNITGEAFSTEATGMTIAVDGEGAVDVLYAPPDAGWHYAQMKIYTTEDEENEHLVDIRGHGATSRLVVTPALVDFGPVTAATIETSYVNIANVGTVSVTLDAAAFSETLFASTYSLPAEIAAGSSLDFPLDASPADEEPTFGTCTLTFTGAEPVELDLRLNACADGDPGLYDEDGDGFSACAGDCDDAITSVRPGGVEACDGVDEDCDGIVDEGTSCYDDDGDGFSEDDGDCVDGDAAIKPSAAEDFDDGIDNNCDGVVDRGSDDPDGDGFSAIGGDCDTENDTVHPGANELADGLDNDCDGVVDEGTEASDDDGDAYTEAEGDCDDTEADVHPNADEAADGVDNDCDGALDEDTEWGDDDGDGWSERGGDCDDGDSFVNPGAYDSAGDGEDTDCDGADS
jgi:Putative metal-binding motif